MGSLTQKQKSLIIGTILGDGYLRVVPGRKNAFLEVNHSLNAKDYVDWKHLMLKDITKSVPKSRKSNKGRIAYRFYTIQHSELSKIHKQFYRGGIKIIPSDLKLDSLILAVWFMDDGSKCRKHDVYLNTQQFNFESQKLLQSKLREFGLESRLNKDKNYYRLRFLKESVKRLNSIVFPHIVIVSSMKYKLSYDPVET